ncbi:MAG: hypothetical protein HY699_01125 [Deltaproteobacteria bacterium]|nr:hypothetical protein [Deltaproteobacteria bacterium]
MIRSEGSLPEAARQSHGISSPSEPRVRGDGDLVVVQPAVLATVDHTFGNIFQRLYHLIRTAASGNSGALTTLETSVRELQSLLELFVDYVAPTPMAMRCLRMSDVATSFRRHLDDGVGAGRVDVVVSETAGATVTADPACLARVFRLLAQSLCASASPAGVRAACGLSSEEGGHFEISVVGPGSVATPLTELRWALAQKLIELQGGDLRQEVNEGGQRWTIRLPQGVA